MYVFECVTWRKCLEKLIYLVRTRRNVHTGAYSYIGELTSPCMLVLLFQAIIKLFLIPEFVIAVLK